MCYSRYLRIKDAKKEKWTTFEDSRIKELVELYGKKWRKISC